MYTNRLFYVLIIALFLVTACARATPTSPPLPSATVAPTTGVGSTMVAEKPGFPTGKFVKSNSGNHGLIFNEDGTFSVFVGSSTIVNGKYSVDGDIYTDESNSEGCPAMSFKYTFDGTNLTFNYVGNPTDDPCGGRRGDFNNVTYTLTK